MAGDPNSSKVMSCSLEQRTEASRVTAQIPDKLRHLEEDWVLAGVRGEGLFDPLRHGLSPRPLGTGCWRGFVERIEDRSAAVAEMGRD